MLWQLIKWNQKWKIRQAEDKVVWILQDAEQKDEEADDLEKKKRGELIQEF